MPPLQQAKTPSPSYSRAFACSAKGLLKHHFVANASLATVYGLLANATPNGIPAANSNPIANGLYGSKHGRLDAIVDSKPNELTNVVKFNASANDDVALTNGSTLVLAIRRKTTTLIIHDATLNGL